MTSASPGLAAASAVASSAKLLQDHVLGALHALGGALDDKVLVPGVWRGVLVHLAVDAAAGVDVLDGLSTLADDQPALVGGDLDIVGDL